MRKDKKIIKSEGNAYVLSCRLVTSLKNKEIEDKHRLVHGTVLSKPDSKRVDHAWVETEGKVIDKTIKYLGPINEFYALTQAIKEEEYTVDEVFNLMMISQTYGPWTKEEVEKVRKFIHGKKQ